MGVKDRLLGTFGDNLAESMTSKAFRAGQGGNNPSVTRGDSASGATVTRGDSAPGADPSAGVTRHRKAVTIEVERIVADPDQPRREFDPEALDLLARSLAERGQLMPIRVRWDAALSAYKIVAGERRWRAARQAGLAVLECVVSDKPQTAEDVLEEQLIENCVREDLKPIEQAQAFKQLMERLGLSYRELADRLRMSHAAVHRAVAVLETPEPVRELVASGALGASAAYEISKLQRAEDQVAVAEAAAEQGLTRDEVAATVRARRSGREAPAPAARREFRLPGGGRVSVTPADSGPDAVVQALRAALKLAQAELKAASTPSGQAA